MGDLGTNPDGVPFVEHEHNGVDPDERAVDSSAPAR